MSGAGTASRLREPALVAAIVISGLWITFNLLAFAFAEAPGATLSRALAGTWGTPYGVGQVLFKATPLVFTGYAFHVAQRSGLPLLRLPHPAVIVRRVVLLLQIGRRPIHLGGPIQPRQPLIQQFLAQVPIPRLRKQIHL